MTSASFDSGLNLMTDQQQQSAGLGSWLGSSPYLMNAAGDASSGGLYRGAAGTAAGPNGLRSLSHPCLSLSAMAAAAAAQAQQQQQQQQHQHQQQQSAAAAAAAAVAAGRLLNQQNAAAAAAMLQAQAAGLGLHDLQQQQQQQQQQLALQQLLQANLHAQTLAGAANLQAAQQLLQAGMHPQHLAAAGLLNPAALAGLGLPTSSSYGSLHNLSALQLQNAAAAAAASAAAAAAAGGSGIPRGASTGSLSGLGDGSRHRVAAAADGSAGSSGGSRGGGRLSRRAADPAVEAERKAQQERLFALDVDRILHGEDKRTTLMIKNIPNKYTQKMLLQVKLSHQAVLLVLGDDAQP
jgi:protein phosphatase 1 regulatory subunit 42